MARPQRRNVDYFPHYISDGKKMFIIETKYGNDGYATWFKLLETLAKSEDHWLDLSDKSNMMFLAARCKVAEQTIIEIISDIAMLGEIDVQLWDEERVVWSDKFVDSVSDAYKNRSNSVPLKDGLILKLRGLGRCKPPIVDGKGDGNQHTILKDTILNQTKENESGGVPPTPNTEIETITFIEPQKNGNTGRENFQAFNPPEVEDVINCFTAVMATMGLPNDAYGGARKLGTDFHNHYRSQGWKKGNELQITEWRPLIPPWLAREKSTFSKPPKPNNQPQERPERSWNKK